MGFAVKDALLKVTIALPNGAATVYSAGIDLGHGTKGDFLAKAEFKVSAPALTTTQQPNAKTLIYSIQHGDDPAFGDVADLYPNVLTQTGAGGVGCAAAEFAARLPVDVKRYVRVKAVGSATGDSSAASLTFEVLL
jgi:hypothetical protein